LFLELAKLEIYWNTTDCVRSSKTPISTLQRLGFYPRSPSSIQRGRSGRSYFPCFYGHNGTSPACKLQGLTETDFFLLCTTHFARLEATLLLLLHFGSIHPAKRAFVVQEGHQTATRSTSHSTAQHSRQHQPRQSFLRGQKTSR